MSPGGRRAAILPLLLLASGAAAMLHEVAWFRLLAPVAGVGALPAAVVAAGALLGLAAGSALGGARADRAARPARVLALGEIAGAVLGVLAPPALGLLDGLGGGPGALVLATLILAAAALPWGFSIPAAFRTVAPGGGGAGDVFRRLYAWNTAGALLGVAAGAALLLEALGNRGTVAVASALQALAAAAALGIPSTSAGAGEEVMEGPRAASPSPLPLLLAAALAGAAGVGSQVAWTRRLGPVLCATFPAYTAVLAVHIGGIALGSALLGPRLGARPARSLAILALAAALLTTAAPHFTGAVVDAVRETWWKHLGDPWATFGLRAAIAAALALPGVLAGSALLPWLIRAGAPGAREAGRTSGRLLAANTAGAAAGGFAVALLLVPAVGTAASLAACGAALALAGACGCAGRGRVLLAGLAVALAAVAAVRPGGDPAAIRSVGPLYAGDGRPPADALTVLAADGVNASVLVRDREGRREFWVEGNLEASNWPTDRLHLGLLGHLPLVLFEARTDRPPEVVLVGLGAGFTAQAAARHAPAGLTVFELEPEVARAAEAFRGIGGGIPREARLVFADGRKAVLDAGGGPIDVLSSDPVHPAVAGSAFLYAAEYYRGASARLSPEGVLVQWLPLYQLHVDDLRLALRTFAAGVPHPYVFVAGRDALLIGTREPLRLSLQRLERAARADTARDLREDGLASAGALLSLLALDPDGVRAVAGTGDLNEDDRLLLELRSGWREAGDEAAALDLLLSRPADPAALLDGPADAAFEAGLWEGGRLGRAAGAWVRGRLEEASLGFAEAAESDPANLFARRMRDEVDIERAFDLLERDRPATAAAIARAVAARPGTEPIRVLDAAEVLAKAGHADEARVVALPWARSTRWPRAIRLAGE
jgi:spermidine synthase